MYWFINVHVPYIYQPWIYKICKNIMKLVSTTCLIILYMKTVLFNDLCFVFCQLRSSYQWVNTTHSYCIMHTHFSFPLWAIVISLWKKQAWQIHEMPTKQIESQSSVYIKAFIGRNVSFVTEKRNGTWPGVHYVQYGSTGNIAT